MTKPKVLIFGCGPAGLIAAQAAEREFGAELLIISVKRPSQLYGCQYLHAPIPGISAQQEYVEYRLEGNVEDYRKKVYGSLTPPVSPQQYEGDHYAWDLRSTYLRLWESFETMVSNVKIMSDEVGPMLNYFKPDVVISSIPLPAICQTPTMHAFTSVSCWAIGDAPELGQHVPLAPPEFTVVCNGTKDVGWYRISNVFGYSTMEWPGHKSKPPVTGVVPFDKPLVSNCDCMPSILRVGRYGRWQKGVLSHEAYEQTAAHIKEKGF